MPGRSHGCGDAEPGRGHGEWTEGRDGSDTDLHGECFNPVDGFWANRDVDGGDAQWPDLEVHCAVDHEPAASGVASCCPEVDPVAPCPAQREVEGETRDFLQELSDNLLEEGVGVASGHA